MENIEATVSTISKKESIEWDIVTTLVFFSPASLAAQGLELGQTPGEFRNLHFAGDDKHSRTYSSSSIG
jgi:hypothetical protein